MLLAVFLDFCCIQHNTRQLETADRPCLSTAWHVSIPGCVSIAFPGTDVVEILFPVEFLPMSVSSHCPWLVSLDGK